jgi:DNA topoisomerase-1
VVESPAKAKTIGKYLGKDYDVVASMGHVRDLPKSDFAVDINGGVSVTYEVTQKGKKVVSSIRKAAKAADLVFLATDPDREGEAIAWHIAEAAKLAAGSTRRVTFTGGPSRLPGTSTTAWSTPSRPAGWSTGSSATSCRRCCGARSGPACPPAGSSRPRSR